MPAKSKFAYEIVSEEDNDYHPTPEQGLHWGVLERALLDATGSSHGGPPWATRDAIRWFDEDFYDRRGISLRQVCDVLSLEIKKIQSFVNICLQQRIIIRNRFVPYKYMKSILNTY